MWNSHIFIQENAFENVACKMTSILSRPQCVNSHVMANLVAEADLSLNASPKSQITRPVSTKVVSSVVGCVSLQDLVRGLIL